MNLKTTRSTAIASIAALVLPILTQTQKTEAQTESVLRVERPYSAPTPEQIKAKVALCETLSQLIRMKEFDASLNLIESNKNNLFFFESLQNSLSIQAKVSLLDFKPEKAAGLIFSEFVLSSAANIQKLIETAVKSDSDKIDHRFFHKINELFLESRSAVSNAEILALLDNNLSKGENNFSESLIIILDKLNGTADYAKSIVECRRSLSYMANSRTAARE